MFAILEDYGAAYVVMSGAGLLHPSGHSTLRVCAPARAGRTAPVRGLLLRRRPGLVGGAGPGVARSGPWGMGLLNNDGGGHESQCPNVAGDARACCCLTLSASRVRWAVTGWPWDSEARKHKSDMNMT